MNFEEMFQILDLVREKKPLVHNMTNVVVTNFTANGLLALGASPVMAYAKEEVADMAKIAEALVLNIGTLRPADVEAMLVAGKSAARHSVPILFDPVGAGATPYRTETAQRIMNELPISLLRGNAAEVANVLGKAWTIKGVDSGEADGEDVMGLAQNAARNFNTTVVITGKTDIVTDGYRTFTIQNGHPILTQVTGTGCLLTSVVGAFAAVEKDYVKAAVAALTAYEVAAEKAVEKTAENQPGSFQIEFLNQLCQLTADTVSEKARVENM